MTLLVVSPDYASHVLPLVTLASAWADAGERVVVATGPATADIVTSFGYERADLRLGRGSNPGVIRADAQPRGEDENLRRFFGATYEGMVDTLRYQADARSHDLLWQPVQTGQAVLDVVHTVQPEQVLVDHLAFSATLALRAAGVPYGDLVLGHPSALPVGDEVYGYPPAWPACFHPDPADLATLRERCVDVRDRFTEQYNNALRHLAPGAEPVRDAFAATGEHVLFNYPAELHDPARTTLLPEHTFLGASLRTERVPDDVAAWLDEGAGEPLVYVSFGSFLSARDDVLATVVEALRSFDGRVAVATGSATPDRLGPLPDRWLARSFLPQVAVLEHAAVAVTHGGNNSVTEALACGVPMVVLPFSTDQFTGAATLEQAGLALAMDPNAATANAVRHAVDEVLTGLGPRMAAELGAALRADPGPQRARRALTA